MSEYTNFDLLLYAAAEQYCNEQVDALTAVPVDGGITERERRRFRRILRRSRRAAGRWVPLRLAAAAVLLCMSLCFTACVCVPSIRAAIKKAIVEWYSEYISVDFKDPDESESPETQTPTPTTIRRQAYVANLPEGYTREVVADANTVFNMDYSLNGEYVFTLSQGIIETRLMWLNSEGQTVDYITVRDAPAILIADTSTGTTMYILVWQDGEYEYNLDGKLYDRDEIIRLAESVMLD